MKWWPMRTVRRPVCREQRRAIVAAELGGPDHMGPFGHHVF